MEPLVASQTRVPQPRSPEPRRESAGAAEGATAAPDARAELASAVDGLLGRGERPAPSRSDAELVEGIREAESALRAALSWQTELIAEAERRGLHRTAGARSAPAWLRELLNIGYGDARSRVVVGRVVAERVEFGGEPLPPVLPATARVFHDREASLAHAQVIEHAMDKLPSRIDAGQRAGVEQLLAEEAKVLSPRELEIAAERVRYLLDQDGALRDERSHVEHRELHLTTDRDGRTLLKGRLDRESGAKLRAALEPLAVPRPGDGGERDRRTTAKRNADALAELVDIALSADELPRHGGQRPQLTITIGHEQLRESLAGDRLGGTIETTGQPITAESARRIACDAELLPVLLDGESRPLDVGRARRSAPPHLRAALLARDGKCAFPACDPPTGASEAHHVRHWADGGATALDNLVMLCAHHHSVVHEQRWEVELEAGRPVFTPPEWVDRHRTPRPGNRAQHEPPDLSAS
ncbi:DUF222 domain-containing protein [Saccharopolyspora sp. MS10]|uniref:HNH endonuclease signature motif containing protein n=1 Tax=Saccharopolyspora sp. MS10 TaxID=3385973 RepID=UPI00399FD1E4